MAQSVYIISTPYHFILAYGIASYVDKNEEKHLIISPHFEDAGKLGKILVNLPKNPFDNWRFLKTRHDKSFFDKIKTIRTNMGLVKKYNHLPATAYIFNIEQPEGQYLAHLNKFGMNIYVEDGIGAYTKKTTDDIISVMLLKKILYGYWFKRCDNQMKCKLIDAVMAFKPELIETDLEKITIPNFFGLMREDGFIQVMSKEMEINPIEADVIILMPFWKQADAMGHDATYNTYNAIREMLFDKHIPTLIKYHPRETRYTFVGYLSTIELPLMSNRVSAELLFANWISPHKILIGDTSTGLLSCKLIAPDAKIISVMDIIGVEDNEGLGKVLDAWHVEKPKKLEEIL